MPITNANAMPMAKCPHCGAEIQLDDYYDFKGDEERECPRCEKTMFVLDVECVMYVRLGTEPNRHNARTERPPTESL